MPKILFLDLDGTVREPKSGAKFINDPHDQNLIEGVKEAIAHYSSREWLIIGITNQGGVAAGHKSIESAINEQKITLDLVPELALIYFCPDFEGLECWKVARNIVGGISSSLVKQYDISEFGSFRKPGAGMIRLALGIVNPSECWMIGDRPEDEQCAAAANINFMWADVWRDRFKKGLGEVDLSDRHIDKEVLLKFLAT